MALASTLPTLANVSMPSKSFVESSTSDTLTEASHLPASTLPGRADAVLQDCRTPCDLSSSQASSVNGPAGSFNSLPVVTTTASSLPLPVPLVPYNTSSSVSAVTAASHSSNAMSTSSVTITSDASIQGEARNTTSVGGASTAGQGTEELREQLEALRKEFLPQVSTSELLSVVAGQGASGASRMC